MVIIEEMYANPPVPESLLDRIQQQTNSVLDLSLCNLIQVPLGAIQETRQQYKKLEGFDLSYNSIRYLSPDFAIDMVNLVRLDLSRNELRKLPENFGDMQDLVYLDIHQNKLETLPISMGKMTHLKYLSISDNPFRAPLCNIFCPGAFGQEISGFAQADLVIKFLAEMSTEITAAGDNSQESFLRRRNSQVHYNERSMTGLEYETDEGLSNASHSSNELAVELDEENNLKISHIQPTTNSRKNERKSAMSKRSKYKSENLTCSSNYSCRSKGSKVNGSTWWGWTKAFVTFAFVLTIVLPFIVSVVIDTSFLDYVAQDSESEFLTSLWKVYKPHHERMETVFYFCFSYVNTPVRLRGPEPSNVVEGFFSSCYSYVANMFSYVRSAFSFI